MKRLTFLFFVLVQGLSSYEVSVCAIFRNEAPYLKEWIEFHKLQGVEHFFLYNHLSTDNYREVLVPYIAEQTVTLIDWPYPYSSGDTSGWLAIQRGAYMNCVELCRKETTWLAVIDVDEFLFCPSGVKLKSFLEPYLKYGALCVNWLIFGTSGLEEIPCGQTMIESLLHCAPLNEPHHFQGKSIIQPKYVKACANVHTFLFQEGFWTVDVKGGKIEDGRYLSTVSHNIIRINHYWTRTERYFRERKIPSRGERRVEETADSLQRRVRLYNKRTDTAILQFVSLLRASTHSGC